MSMLIELSDRCHIDPDLVAEVTINERADTLKVRMRDGIGHNLGPDYGKSIYETRAALVNRINAARTK